MGSTERLLLARRSLLSTFLRRSRIFTAVLLVVSLATTVQGRDEPTFGAAGASVASVPMVDAYDGLLSFEDRVRHQRRIEEVYWRHRIWPSHNPNRKPSHDAMLSDAVLRERVATYLEKSAALEIFWSRPLSGEQLQAEVNRVVRDTKNPDLLRELFAALDDDPLLVAECLARPVLVDRLMRNWYLWDTRVHGALREEAEAALAAHRNGSAPIRDLGGEYRETTWRFAREEPQGASLDMEAAEPPVADLSAEEWRDLIERLALSFGLEREPETTGSPSDLLGAVPIGTLSRLVEENDRFVVKSVLLKEPDRLQIATVSWVKRPFDEWWVEEGRTVVESHGRIKPFSPPLGGYELQAPTDDGCTADTWTALWYVPSPRSWHTAVWTGAEMIVWGGGDLNTGGRYDPATDSWTATSTGTGVPTGRWGHIAVWTGTEMVVWGGSDSVHYHNSGGRYDPATDSWTPTSTGTGVPVGRRSHAAVWTGTEMIVWGGSSAGGGDLNTGGRYDPATDSWTPTSFGSGVPTSRSIHTAVWTGAEMIVWGGYDQGEDLNTGWRYDPATDSWTATSKEAGVPTVRRSHTAVWSGTEMIVWGGLEGLSGYLITGGRYDPATDSWTPTSTGAGVPTGRRYHKAVWTGTEMIVWGGNDGEDLNTGGRYDPAADSWTGTSMGAGVPTGRRSHTLVWTGAEMIVWGGASGGQRQITGGRYDPATDGWAATSTGGGVPSPRNGQTAVWTGSEMIVWGGWDGGVVNTGGRYDPATDNWTATSTGDGVPTARVLHTAVWTGKEMIVWGGGYAGGSPQYFGNGGRYDPTTDIWTAISTGAGAPTKRKNHSAVWTGKKMIVWGGYDGGFLNTGGRYDPVTDSWTATSTGAGVPTPRYGPPAVWTGTEMIVWGGSGGEYFDTGGRYDPATNNWTATSTDAGVPTARVGHTTVWTGTEMIVWGGYGSNYWIAGGRYEPATDSWSATSTGAGVPSFRSIHTAIWTGAEMIVWGGEGGTYLNTGGRYDPATDSWTATSTGEGVPTARWNHTAVWTGTGMIVWGGFDDDSSRNSGGNYCACEGATVSTWSPDSDADGFGVESTSIPSCSQPPGYVAVSGDCDDTNADIYTGAAEVNDGLDNQCPGDAGHGLVDEITGACGFLNPDDRNELSWPPQAGATSYEIARSANEYFVTDCETWQTATPSWADSEPVPAGGRFHYLVRSLTPNAGSWGESSAGLERTWVCP